MQYKSPQYTFKLVHYFNAINAVQCANLKAYLPTYYTLDVLWGQRIKLIQVASTSELHENQRNDLLFFEIVPCHFLGGPEVQT